MEKKIITISGPAGAGKSTLINHLLEQDLPISLVVSVTTRDKRDHEKEGEEYYFVSCEKFNDMIQDGQFIEHKEVYPGVFYGTLNSELERTWTQGKAGLMNLAGEVALKFKDKFGDSALAIMVRPENKEVLRERLIARGDREESVERRLKKIDDEMALQERYDRVIVNENGKADEAKKKVAEIVREFLGK